MRPKPIKDWTAPERRQAERVADFNLEGVGLPMVMHTENGEVAIHWRRAMTDQEIAALPRRNTMSP